MSQYIQLTAYLEYHAASEDLAVDEVMACFKARIIFKHYITKEHMDFRVKNL
jgi:hypothetical protein